MKRMAGPPTFVRLLLRGVRLALLTGLALLTIFGDLLWRQLPMANPNRWDRDDNWRPDPMDDPTEADLAETHPLVWEEVWAEELAPDPEPTFVPQPIASSGSMKEDTLIFGEPIFEAEPSRSQPEEPIFDPLPGAPDFSEPLAGPPPPNRPLDAKGVQWFEEEPSPFARGGGVMARMGSTAPFWIAGGIMAVLVIAALWALAGRTPEETLPANVLTPIAEGVAGSVQPPDDPAADDAFGLAGASEVSREPVAEPVVIRTLVPGQRVVVGNTNGQGIRLRSAPGTASLTLAIYNDGSVFTVLNPGGDHNVYPVNADGYQWYRIQIADSPGENLTGWAAADFLIP